MPGRLRTGGRGARRRDRRRPRSSPRCSSHSLHAFGHALGLSQFFVAVVIVALVGNAAEHGGAVVIARRGNMAARRRDRDLVLDPGRRVRRAGGCAGVRASSAAGCRSAFRPVEIATMAGAARRGCLRHPRRRAPGAGRAGMLLCALRGCRRGVRALGRPLGDARARRGLLGARERVAAPDHPLALDTQPLATLSAPTRHGSRPRAPPRTPTA